MKNSGLIVDIAIVLIAVVLIGGLTAYILANNTTNTETLSTPKTYDIEIKDFAFTSSSLTIKKGDSVRWTNRDSVDHTATADNNAFDSPLLSDDESFTFTFNNAGEFSYYCKPHPYMKAKIIVE